MAQQFPPISDVLIAPDPPRGGSGPLSLGLLLGDGRAHWGDVLLPAADAHAAVADAYRLRELSTATLCGQWPDSLTDFSGRLRQAAGEAGEAAVRALQWAYLDVVLARPEGGERLRREYGLATPPTTPPAQPICCLEISDHAATAERIDALLRLRPAALGYRLTSDRAAEAIGEKAEHLQRFVRDLGRRAEALAPGEGYRPAMFLGLNGALGRLAGDPVRHIGKVLGNVVGLQSAAGERRLILEAPFVLDDPLAQAANLHRLKDFIRRTPDSLGRRAPTQVVAPAPRQPDEAAVYVDTAAVHGLVFDGVIDDPDHALRAIGRAGAVGLDAYWRVRGDATPRQMAAVVALAVATGTAALVVSGDGGDVLPLLASRLLVEAAARPAAGQPMTLPPNPG